MRPKKYKQLEFDFTSIPIREPIETQTNRETEPPAICPMCNSDLRNSGFTDLCIYCSYRFRTACSD